MRNITVRLAEPKDAELFLKYEAETKNNLWDPAAGLYPSSFTLCTENEQGVVMFLPVQPMLMLESLAIRPESDPKDVAFSLRKLIDQLVDTAKKLGMGEIAFVCKDSATEKFAEHHGFEKLPWNLYRLKIKDY